MSACVKSLTYSLSAAQTEIWLTQQRHPDSPVYNIGQYTVIEGAVDPALFEAALRQMINEASSLRLQFVESDEGLRQYVGSIDWSLPLIDASEQADPQAAAEAWMRADFEQPADLLRGPLFNYTLVKVAPERFLWYQRYHRIAMDEFGFFLITQRVAHVYSAMCQGVEADKCPFGCVLQLLESDTQYRTSAQWTRDEAYWRKRHTEGSAPATLANQFAPALQHPLRQTTYLASQSVRKYATNDGQLAQFMMAALAAYLHRLTGAQDVILGFPVATRLEADRHIPGMMSNVLPLRLTVQPDMHLLPLMQQVAQEMRYGFQYQRYPSEVLRRKLGLMPGQPLFGPTVNVMPFDYDLSFGRHASTNHNLFNGPIEDLMIGIYLLPDRCQLKIDFNANPALYSEDELIIHQRRFVRFLEALAAEPTRPIGDIDLLDAAERHQLLVEWNATKRDYPLHLCIHQLFEAQAARTPDATALVYDDQALTYAALNARANRLAHQLIELGVKPDTHVAICVERSPAMVIGLLAILKAGGAYVPLDPAYPAERLAYMLEDSAPVAVLVQAATQDLIGKQPVPVINLDADVERDYPEQNPQVPSLAPHHPAYVIYTSGSTGQPKGVEATIGGLANRLLWFVLDVLKELPVTALKTSISFVDSVTEVLGTLLAGGKLVVFDRATVKDVSLFARRLSQTGVSHLVVVPSLLKYFLEKERDQLGGLRVLVCSGERLAPELAQRVAAVWPNIRLLNFYGSSEVNGDVTFYEYGSAEQIPPQVVIGRPIANTQVYILDDYGQPVPLGVAGEIYIGGAGVARGYLNRPELTTERFVVDPFQGNGQKRMYKTGDLGRWLADGNIEYLGRNDHQVKIRGFRIELGEIEACLAQHPQVRDVAVLACGEGSDTQLVAYVAAEPSAQLASALCAHVAASLPEHMVPVAFVQLDALPLTPNGKLDRHALPAPDADAFAHQAYEAPQGELETTLAAIWSELLGLERIGRHDSFFALGGHSLLAVQMIERLRHLGLGLSVRALFDTPTLSVLAQSLGQHREAAVPPNLISSETSTLTPELLPLIDLTQADIDRIVEQVPGGITNIQDVYALSPLQDGILFHHLLTAEGDPYLMSTQLVFDNRELLDRYLYAVQQVVNRHDILRTAFAWENLSCPAQVVWRHAPLSITELTLDPADGLPTEQLAQRFNPREHRIKLTQAPLLRFVIAQNSDGRWLLLQLLHHLIGDNSTLERMYTEVQAFIEGRGETLPPAQPFRNLVAQARLGISEEAHEQFFTDMLADIAEPTLPFGLAEVHRDGAQVAESHQMLPQKLNDRLRAKAKRLGVSLASLCHLAWAQVLARTSAQQKVVFGTVLFGRMQAGDGADSAMGLFINTLPLRVDLDGNVRDSVRDTHTRLATLLEHEYASLALAQRCSAVLSGTPLFSALLNYRHNETPSGESRTTSGIEFLSVEERTNYPLMLSVEDFGNALGLTAQAVWPLDPVRVCGYMHQALQSLAEALEYMPEMPVRQLEVLPDSERALLLQTWNATKRDYPLHLCIHQLFEAQAARTPDATALVYDDQALTYAALNARANRLAHQLIELGVKPDTHVAICVERSPAMVIGLLAILKAGGAYVPLDPAYPAERLAYMLEDSAPAAVLVQAATQDLIGKQPVPVINLDAGAERDYPEQNPQVPSLTPHHPAYVIYTSGSTGQPKGVEATIGGLANRLLWFVLDVLKEPPVTALKTSISFVDSVTEALGTLLAGGKLVVFDRATVKDVSLFARRLSQTGVSHLVVVPSLLKYFLEKERDQLDGLRVLICSGERLAPELAQRVAAVWPSIRLLNFYGSSEVNGDVTFYEYGSAEQIPPQVVIGRPIANTQIYILDHYGQPAPLGVAGEIYVGGAGVARGYLNRPELTTERFVVDPFQGNGQKRMYKTGDLGRWLADGNIEYLGRNDHQVKIRGFRI
ncbi:amino acid adenylation domain-containing protein [Mycetohabitans rhizoxinica]|uniref:amino acid adenylation domain-containing protein n=1 Tax=Mycetohabitans rhizoxinica TaxID=412963 RepID=UPI0030D10F11